MSIPLQSDRVVLRCPKCDMHLTPRDIRNSTGVVRFAIKEGKCPLCTLNAIVQGQPELENVKIKPYNPTLATEKTP